MHEQAEELEKRLRLITSPLAIKLLRSSEDIAEGAIRPLKDLGYRLALCQGFAMSRREGAAVAMLKEDMWCFEPVVGYGMAEPPRHFLEGYNRFPRDVASLEAGSNYASDLPKLEVGRCVGAESAPLTTASFEPDLVMIYCDSSQLSLLLLAREYEDGHDLKCSLSSHAGCVYSVVPAIKTGDYTVALPCRGDRRIGLAGDEMIFTMPADKLEYLLGALRYLETTGSKFPVSYHMKIEPDLPESYVEIAKMMGMMED